MAEGGVYIISNFYTREATGSLRPTSSKIIINFSNLTTVEKVEKDDFMIPMNKFEFVDLGDLFDMASNYENPDSPPFSTDIIGVLEDFERVKPIQTMYGERNIVKFRITDGRYSHKVSVWGQLAVTITHVHEKIVERPIMAIVTSSKLKIFKSSVQISTLPSSKIYLNLDNDYVNAYKSRLEEEGYKVSENVVGSPTHVPLTPPVIQTITLSELSEKTNTDDLKMLTTAHTALHRQLNQQFPDLLSPALQK
ncbi:hypothetical protein POM88_023860 [Heracleum sosnowskyi]|uniref:Uncharacterized protein n=1 Tax=Heracleum sosnowskyi TaxID=360622 RepID=A0AAD8ILI4_9APIA|nr:hypothetical protein POM88_023860 [Heracleum sosnowskyi]